MDLRGLSYVSVGSKSSSLLHMWWFSSERSLSSFGMTATGICHFERREKSFPILAARPIIKLNHYSQRTPGSRVSTADAIPVEGDAIFHVPESFRNVKVTGKDSRGQAGLAFQGVLLWRAKPLLSNWRAQLSTVSASISRSARPGVGGFTVKRGVGLGVEHFDRQRALSDGTAME